MQRISKDTLKFLDDELNELSKICFGIDRESRVILGILAKHGPLSQTKIASLGKRRMILSRDIIKYRISKSDLSGKDDFLSVKKGRKIGNLKKVEKVYSLTFKGILASLSEINLSENFWITNYMNVINEISDETTTEEFLHHIYHHIILFLIFHSKHEGMLTKYDNLEEDFNGEYWLDDGLLCNLLFQQKIKGIPFDFKYLFIDSLKEFLVSFYIVGNLLKESLKINNIFTNKYKISMNYEKCVDLFFREWMWTMFSIVDDKSQQISKLYEDDKKPDDESDDIIVMDSFGEDIWHNFELTAQEELMKINPEFHYDSGASLFND